MLPERVKEDLKSGTVQNILWRDLQAFSSDEINKDKKQNSPGKRMDNEEKREQMERKNKNIDILATDIQNLEPNLTKTP